MNLPKTIAIGSDHAGFEYKAAIKIYLDNKSVDVIDVGTFSQDSCDYPDYAHAVANELENGKAEMGILICGSANGVAITANKHSKIRAALCWQTEIATLSRQHNDANIICLPARFVTVEESLEMIHAFLSTDFEGGRHQKRVDKI